MNIKARLKSYSFWVSIASAIFLLIKVLGQSLGFSVDESLYNDVFTALCGVLVICGIIAPPTAKESNMLPTSTSSANLIINEKINNTQNNDKLNNEENINKTENFQTGKPNETTEDLEQVENESITIIATNSEEKGEKITETNQPQSQENISSEPLAPNENNEIVFDAISENNQTLITPDEPVIPEFVSQSEFVSQMPMDIPQMDFPQLNESNNTEHNQI